MKRLNPRVLAGALVTLLEKHSPRDVAAAAHAYLAGRQRASELLRVQVALRAIAKRDRIVFETALPLTDEEQHSVRKILHAKWSDATIRFVDKPDVLGGFRIRLGDRLVDNSLVRAIHQLGRVLTEVHHV